MDEKTYKLTIFLMKESITRFEEGIKSDKEVEYRGLNSAGGFDGVIVVSKSAERVPEWIEFLNVFSEEKIQMKKNVSNKAVMLVRIKNRIMALTFGHGRYFLKEECIEKNFGLLAALNMLNPEKIRSINAATIEDMVVQVQKQSSYATGQEEFSLNAMNDIMTSITGKSQKEYWASSVSGRDSLVVSVKLFPVDLEERLEYYLTAYESVKYKEQGFAWIDNIREERDKGRIEILENIVLERMQRKDLTNIFVAPPETVDWSAIKGFMISGAKKRREKSANYNEEPNIEEYLNVVREEVDFKEKIKKDRLLVMTDDESVHVVSSLYDAIVAQIMYEEELYILCNGRWFRVENDFFSSVKSFVAKIPVSDIDLPECSLGEDEGKYNERVSESSGVVLLDKKLVSVDGGVRQIEACDLFTKNRQFVHVKNRSSSAQLSHLFAQGRISAQCFISDEEYRKQVYQKVKGKLGKDIFSYRSKPGSEEFEVVYAIIAKKIGPIEENLPFFSMVNLMLAVQELDRMHMKFSVKMILKK